MYTYIIKSQGLYKIGRTKNMQQRMSNYALHNPSFNLVVYIDGRDDLEKDIHDFLRDYRVAREWFKLPSRFLRDLFDALNNNPEVKYWKGGNYCIKPKKATEVK